MKRTLLHNKTKTRCLLRICLVIFVFFSFIKIENSSKDFNPRYNLQISDLVTVDLSPIEEMNDNALATPNRSIKVVKKIIFPEKIFQQLFLLIDPRPIIFFENFKEKASIGVISLLYLFHLF